MPVTVTLNPFQISDSEARDLTRINETLRVGATVNVGDIDATATQITFREIDHISVGCQMLNSVTGEHITVSVVPADAGSPCTVKRGDCGDTPIPAYPKANAAHHTDGEQWFVLEFGGLIDMGMQGAQVVTAGYIQRLGANSETLSGPMSQINEAQAAIEATLSNAVQS